MGQHARVEGMYEEFYGFAEPPFTLSPDPRFLYRGAPHAAAMAQLLSGVGAAEELMILLGEAGTGKTTLCRALVDEVPATTVAALLQQPPADTDGLLREALLAFGVASADSTRGGGLAAATSEDLAAALRGFVKSLVPLDAGALLIVDEAHQLPMSVLAELRRLAARGPTGPPPLQVVLAGQLHLLDVLDDLGDRRNGGMTRRAVLDPLGREDVERYIAHRVTTARPTRNVRFTNDAATLVHRVSGGVPRLVNLVCDRALMAGHEAGTREITPALVSRATSALGIETPSESRNGTPPDREPGRRWGRAAGLAGALVLAGGGFTVWTTAAGDDGPMLPPAPVPQVMDTLAPASMDRLVRVPPPPMGQGPFSVLLGTYDDPDAVARVEEALLAESLPLYAVDVAFPDGVRRRLLIGRYETLGDAQAVKLRVAETVADAIVVFGWQERLRRLGDGRPVHYTAP